MAPRGTGAAVRLVVHRQVFLGDQLHHEKTHQQHNEEQAGNPKNALTA